MKTTQSENHTPGPWTIYRWQDGQYGIREIMEREDLVNTNSPSWVEITETEDAANAALIGAAPDMLLALKMANELMNEHFQVDEEEDAGNYAHECIRNAIRKAQPITE